MPFDSDPRSCGEAVEGGRTALDNKTSLLNTPSARSFTGPRFRDYNPGNYTDGPGSLDKAALYEDGGEPRRDGGGSFTRRFRSLLRFLQGFDLSASVFTARRQECVENKILNPKSFPGNGHSLGRPLDPRSAVTSVFPPAACPTEQLELVGQLLKELSQGQGGEKGPEERRGTLLELLKVAREDALMVWDEHFKTMLLLLLETLGDKDVRTPPPSEV